MQWGLFANGQDKETSNAISSSWTMRNRLASLSTAQSWSCSHTTQMRATRVLTEGQKGRQRDRNKETKRQRRIDKETEAKRHRKTSADSHTHARAHKPGSRDGQNVATGHQQRVQTSESLGVLHLRSLLTKCDASLAISRCFLPSLPCDATQLRRVSHRLKGKKPMATASLSYSSEPWCEPGGGVSQLLQPRGEAHNQWLASLSIWGPPPPSLLTWPAPALLLFFFPSLLPLSCPPNSMLPQLQTQRNRYHGKMSKEDADQALSSHGRKNGLFLVRRDPA